jgi:hypothetical protein
VIVPYDENTAGYTADAYSEEYLGKYITQPEFNEIITYCSRKMQHLWMYVKDNDKSTLPHYLKILSLLILSFLISYIVGIFCVVDIIIENEASVYLAFFCFVVRTSLAFGLTIFNHCRAFEKFRTPEEMIKDELNEYFKAVNPKYPEIQFNFNETLNRIEVDVLKYKGSNDDISSHKTGRTRGNDEISKRNTIRSSFTKK